MATPRELAALQERVTALAETARAIQADIGAIKGQAAQRYHPDAEAVINAERATSANLNSQLEAITDAARLVVVCWSEKGVTDERIHEAINALAEAINFNYGEPDI